MSVIAQRKAPIRVIAALGLVTAATVLGLVVSANNASASVLLLLVVAVAALLGRVAGAVAAATGAAALNFFFTPPLRTLSVSKPADVFALAAFAVVGAFVGTLVARVTELRHLAERREREARIRLDLTQRLFAGEHPATAVPTAAEALRQLFGFGWCRLDLAGVVATAGGRHANGPELLRVSSAYGHVEAQAERALAAEDHALLEALVANLGTSVERVRLEDVAREARVAAAVGRTRSGFLSAVSHNLRTPLASIKASVGTLRSTELDLPAEDRRELIDTIYEEADRLERLVTKVLDLSRIRAGGLEVEPVSADLADVVRAAIRRVRPLIRAHSIRLDLADDLPAVTFDIGMIEQVLMNLLENAIRFGPPGSEIRISAQAASGGVQITVADRGDGVPPEHRDKIFDEFYRVDARHESTGTGLGLAIVRALVEAHGGTVWYQEGAGGGAIVGFELPGRGG